MLYWCKYVDSLGALQGSMSFGDCDCDAAVPRPCSAV